ncbi:molybdopterin molybdotransferase MoeA [Oceanomicrobium pacificus]|uniref:Molybdopterin molybdenumtransferase n=1 Tax=Oceanomicrobium pacificus TaxID=2692916 RepID=A0A6B0TSR7_9RHOB|nr:gephyrin-like molybdotransferase Glp [Oceanomicrobium pacificus]MXU65819.1 molybdopterin molybdenumtransferase MoeA [Oceanomicrobium pacificus]
MISVEEARERIAALLSPLEAEQVPLAEAGGRVLAAPVRAARTQPPFRTSIMDGYAMRSADARPGHTLPVVGEAAAGRAFDGSVPAGCAIRIFTGAPVPDPLDRVVIQEDVRRDGDRITLNNRIEAAAFIRPVGADFETGMELGAPRRLGPADIALIAAMGVATLPCIRQPRIALIATGDELVMPGAEVGPDQIVASNSFGLKAMLEASGARCRLLPIARDTVADLQAVLRLAEGSDLIVTIGGASVGDHDLVQTAAEGAGLSLDFYKIAMRPGKPLMAGRLGDATLIGLPGNPVSAMVCGQVFLRPMLDVLAGLGLQPMDTRTATLTRPMGPNGPRAHFMRATVERRADGLHATPAERQDSALLSVLSASNALLIRPPHDPARASGDPVEVMQL